MVEFFRDLAQNKLVVAIASIVFGFVLVIMQTAALDWVISTLGKLLLICAAVYAIMYAVGSEKRRSNLVLAVVLGLVGLFLAVNPRAIVNIFPTLVGIVLVVNGVANFLHSRAFVPAGSSWTTPMVLSVAVAALGLVMILAPGLIIDVLMLFMGIALIVNGVGDLAVLYANKELAR